MAILHGTKSMHYAKVLLFISLVLSSTAFADISIEVMALFKDKAMVMIDNEQQLLKVGEPAKSGVKLIKATSKYALLEVNGEQSKFALGNRVQASYAAQKKKKLLVYPDSNGMFKTTGSINGYTVNFLVDTGASTIAFL